MSSKFTTVNADLKRERGNLSFDPSLLTYVLDGGIAATRRRRYIENLAINDSEFNGPNFDFLDREARFNEGLRKEKLLAEKVKSLGLNDAEAALYTMNVMRDGDTGMGLHRLAFVPVMHTQTTEEQRKKWLPLIHSNKMIGCYAQTEIGHGSHVRGLETTANYDAKTQEFIMNTPTLSGIKWWPGNLGKSSNHALVLAQLYINSDHKGLYPFLVQIRDLETHEPLRGIDVGDIGPKYGGDMNDNGYLKMDNVRIPRENMLMKHAQVLPDGTFVPPKNAKLTYSGMLAIRAVLPMAAAKSLAMGVTTATRYSCVRRQSELRPGAREPQILDYTTQQHKLFPLIATAYAMWFTAQNVKKFHDDVIAEINQGNFERLIELHGTCAVLKAWCTSTSAIGIEQCRLSCGGHGYSQASGLPKLFSSSGVVGSVTAEGEATVLLLQGARYLMKCAANVQQGKKLDLSTSYLAQNFGKFTYQGDEDTKHLLDAFQYRAAYLTKKAATRLQNMMGEGKEMHEAWNASAVFLVKAAQAHAEYLLMDGFINRLQSEGDSTLVRKNLSLLAAVYGIYTITQNGGDFVQESYMTGSQLDFLKEKLLQLYEKLRPDAVGFVDAFDFDDAHLGVLGRFDGNVYEELFQWAQQSQLNKTQVHESYHKYLKPIIHRESKL